MSLRCHHFGFLSLNSSDLSPSHVLHLTLKLSVRSPGSGPGKDIQRVISSHADAAKIGRKIADEVKKSKFDEKILLQTDLVLSTLPIVDWNKECREFGNWFTVDFLMSIHLLFNDDSVISQEQREGAGAKQITNRR